MVSERRDAARYGAKGMAMKERDQIQQCDVSVSTRSKRARLHSLLFAGAALGTGILTLGAADPKVPPFRGD